MCIAQALKARPFRSFDRLGAERGTIEGAGLGLAITRRPVEAMGGSIRLESEVGVSCLFWVQLVRA